MWNHEQRPVKISNYRIRPAKTGYWKLSDTKCKYEYLIFLKKMQDTVINTIENNSLPKLTN